MGSQIDAFRASSSVSRLISSIAAATLLITPLAGMGDEADTRVPESECHGHPNWCLKVANETDTTVKVLIDGEDIWRMAPGEKDWFPLPGGEHLVNVCLLYVFSGDKCLAPEKMKDGSDFVVIVYPQ